MDNTPIRNNGEGQVLDDAYLLPGAQIAPPLSQSVITGLGVENAGAGVDGVHQDSNVGPPQGGPTPVLGPTGPDQYSGALGLPAMVQAAAQLGQAVARAPGNPFMEYRTPRPLSVSGRSDPGGALSPSGASGRSVHSEPPGRSYRERAETAPPVSCATTSTTTSVVTQARPPGPSAVLRTPKFGAGVGRGLLSPTTAQAGVPRGATAPIPRRAPPPAAIEIPERSPAGVPSAKMLQDVDTVHALERELVQLSLAASADPDPASRLARQKTVDDRTIRLNVLRDAINFGLVTDRNRLKRTAEPLRIPREPPPSFAEDPTFLERYTESGAPRPTRLSPAPSTDSVGLTKPEVLHKAYRGRSRFLGSARSANTEWRPANAEKPPVSTRQESPGFYPLPPPAREAPKPSRVLDPAEPILASGGRTTGSNQAIRQSVPAVEPPPVRPSGASGPRACLVGLAGSGNTGGTALKPTPQQPSQPTFTQPSPDQEMGRAVALTIGDLQTVMRQQRQEIVDEVASMLEANRTRMEQEFLSHQLAADRSVVEKVQPSADTVVHQPVSSLGQTAFAPIAKQMAVSQDPVPLAVPPVQVGDTMAQVPTSTPLYAPGQKTKQMPSGTLADLGLASMAQASDILYHAVMTQGFAPRDAGRILHAKCRLALRQPGQKREILSGPTIAWAEEMVSHFENETGEVVDPSQRPSVVFGGASSSLPPTGYSEPQALDSLHVAFGESANYPESREVPVGNAPKTFVTVASQPVQPVSVPVWTQPAQDVRVITQPQAAGGSTSYTKPQVQEADPNQIGRPWSSSYETRSSAPEPQPSGTMPSGGYRDYRDRRDTAGPAWTGDFRREDRSYGPSYSAGRYDYGRYEEEKNRRRDAIAALQNLSYNGSNTDLTWECFADRFLPAVKLGGWDEETSKVKLNTCLKGAASRTASTLPKDASMSVIWDHLSRRYGVKGQEATFEMKLAKRSRDLNSETAQSFLDDVSYLCRNAYPRSSDYDLEQSIKKYFLLGHPQAYRNHLNASVNLEKGTLEDLVQACQQYERLEIQLSTVSAKKPAVRSIDRGTQRLTPELTVARFGVRDESSASESDDSSGEVDVCRTLARKGRRRGSKAAKRSKRSKRNATATLRALEAAAAVFSLDPEDGYDMSASDDQWSDPIILSDAQEDILDAQLEQGMAIVSSLAPGASAGNFNRDSRNFRGRNLPWGNRKCFYCNRGGHGLRYCRQIWRDYPDGRFPAEVAQMLLSTLLSPQTSGQMRRQRPAAGRSERVPQPQLRAITAPPVQDGGGGGTEAGERVTTEGTLNSQRTLN